MKTGRVASLALLRPPASGRQNCSTAYSVAKLESSGVEIFLLNSQLPAFDYIDFPGGHTAGATPVPIPNTEVKPRRADDTARVTVWERRSLPGLFLSPLRGKMNGPLRFNRDGPFFFVRHKHSSRLTRDPSETILIKAWGGE